MMPSMGTGSSLDKLLKAWGITFENSKVVADLTFKSRFRNRNNQPEEAPAVLSITSAGINKEDVITMQINSLLVPFAGVFSGTPAKDLKQTVLVKTTADSQLVEGFLAQMSGEQIAKDFKASGTVYPIAIRLTGKFKSAFPDGNRVSPCRPISARSTPGPDTRLRILSGPFDRIDRHVSHDARPT